MGLDLRNFLRGVFVVIFLFFACWCANQHVAEKTSEAATLPIRPSSALIGAQWWVPGNQPLLSYPPISDFFFFFLLFCGVFLCVCGFVSQHDGETWESELDFRLLGLLLPCKSKRLECKSHFLGPLFKNRVNASILFFINLLKMNFKTSQ